MSVTISQASPRDARAVALLRESHALMEALFAPEENFALDIDALCSPDIRFFAAEEGEQFLGCAALAIRPGYGEVKSMFVAPEARGIGLAAKLLQRVEEEARKLNLPLLRLETGDVLQAAMNLYERRGFVRRGPFGDYGPNRTSIFLEKRISA